MTESQENTIKMLVSLISVFVSAVAILVFIFVAAMTASCAAPKSASEAQSQLIFGVSRTCNDGVSEITYHKDIFEVCSTDAGTFTVHDVGCDGANLEVCDNEMNYIVVGGKAKTFSRNCVVLAEAEKQAIKAHQKCLSEVLK